MRKALLPVLVVVLALAALVGWRQGWFAPADGGPAGSGASLAPETIEARGELAGAAGLRLEDADPKDYEGDPVGRLSLSFGTASVTGRVLETDGTPIRFARVTVVLPPPDGGRSVRTTKEGRFEIRGLAALEHDLRAAADGHRSRTVRTPALAAGVDAPLEDIVLSKALVSKDGVRVKVVEAASGRPVAGAKVTVSTLNYALIVSLGAERAGISDVVTREGVTDDLGVLLVEGLPVDKYDVVVRVPGFVLEAVENVVLAAGHVETVNVAVKPGLAISGTVVDTGGVPIVGAFVTGLASQSFRSYAAVQTTANGAFTLDGLAAGSYMLFAGSDDAGTGLATGVPAGERGARIELKGVGTVKGRVTRGDGTAVAEYGLRPYTSGPFNYVYSRIQRIRDPDGRFEIRLPPGAYLLDVKAADAAVTTTASVTVTPDHTTEVVIKLAPEGIVKGVVTDPDGNHLAGAEVYVKSGGFPPVPIREKYVRADGDGAFVLRGLALEQVNLHVRHAGYALAIVTALPAEPANAKELTVRLGAGARVEGHVRTKDGTPVPGERVNLFQGFDFFAARSAFTDGAGAFAFTAVAKGDYQCSVGRFEANAQGQTQTLAVPDDGVVPVEFAVEGDKEGSGTISGTVTLGGKPLAGATLVATDERGEAAGVTVTTGVDGTYVAAGLRPGRVRVQASTAEGALQWKSGTLASGGAPLVLDVAFGASRFSGVLVGADGKVTVSGAWVQAEIADATSDEGGWSRVRGFVNSGNDGRFTFQGLAPGTYRLRITGSMSGYATKLTDGFPLGDGESKDVGRIVLASGGGISGRVTDAQGTSLEGVGVSLENARGEPVFLFSLSSTGSDGRYGLEGLELGSYTVVFDKRGYAPARKAAVVGGATAVPVDVVLTSGGVMLVSVEDETGAPVQDARIELYVNGKRLERTLTIANFMDASVSRTKADGTTRIPDLAPGTYAVKAVKSGHALLADPPSTTVTPGGEAQVRVILRAGG